MENTETENTQKNIYTAREMFYNGCSFAAGGELCQKSGEKNFYNLPLIINYSLSCEILLKALLVLSSKEIPLKHELKVLFELLPEEMQLEINAEMIEKHGSLLNSLGIPIIDEISNAFITWRYIYEKIPGKFASINIDTDYLITFCEILREKCCQAVFQSSYSDLIEKKKRTAR